MLGHMTWIVYREDGAPPHLTPAPIPMEREVLAAREAHHCGVIEQCG